MWRRVTHFTYVYRNVTIKPPLVAFQQRYSNGTKLYLTEDGQFEEGMPTFEEILEEILAWKHASADPHWSRYVDLCHPCELDFDFIGKVETLESDGKIILSHLVRMEVEKNDILLFNRKSNLDTHNAAFSNIKKLSSAVVQRLYRKYEVDFQLFGYSFHNPNTRSDSTKNNMLCTIDSSQGDCCWSDIWLFISNTYDGFLPLRFCLSENIKGNSEHLILFQIACIMTAA